jgi:flagellar biosynthetic protein FliP
MKLRLLPVAAVAAAIIPCAAVAAPLNIDPVRTMSSLTSPAGISSSVQIITLMTVLSLAPAILVMVTSFTRIIIILSVLRQALSLPQMPPGQVLIGMALFLSFFIMAPTLNTVNKTALNPYMKGQINEITAYNRAITPFREFMLRQTRKKDHALFISLARLPKPKTIKEVPTYVIVPSFLISELKTGFEIGFLIYIPFMVIDMLVASVLMSMGMMMVPPAMFSLPFKLLLFVLIDGWNLLARGIVMSFR